ncbi:MAG TPA: iron-sulfur cluster assembly scaffold protein [Patescibacteria group bacterium]|nr:iron-sulfur cluster assembly scaffold protein [Patescibacteria group bacterium]
MDFYREHILDHYQHPISFGRLPHPTISVFEANPLCGDEIGIDLEVQNGNVKNVAFYGSGCAISIASASMLMEHIHGKKLTQIKKMTPDEMLKLVGVQLTPARVKCALLGFSVLQKCIEQHETRKEQS